jgi:FkbM family methyltransferase
LNRFVKRVLAGGLWALLGRRNLARLGRFLYGAACLDGEDDFRANGEALVWSCLVRLAREHAPAVILDVGANVGNWTASLVRQLRRGGVPGRVHAFEACRETFDTLTRNLGVWGMTDVVEAHHLALSSKAGAGVCYSLGPNQGRNGLYAPEGEVSEAEPVECSTLDQWCAWNDLGDVLYVKVDAEGHDCEILHGARGLLLSGKISFLQFEYNWRWVAARRFLRDAFELAASTRYRLGKITRKGIEWYPHWDFELESFRQCNFMMARADRAHLLPAIRWWKGG